MSALGLSAVVRLCWACTALLACSLAGAANGINLIGFGAQSSLMAGADTAYARDTSSLNTNPAGLAQIDGATADFYASLYATDIAHADSLGNDRRASNDLTLLGGAGHARKLRDRRFTVGVGLFVQGGAGAVYKDLATPFGTREDFSALTGIVKVAPGFAYQPSDALALGAALSIVYSSTRQRLFPGTSVFNAADPSRSFFGAEIRDAHALRARLRLGLQVRARPNLTFGAAFANRVSLPLRGGHLDSNQSAIGLGNVRYGDARIEGLGIPREISIGAAWQATPRTLVSVKLSRLYWSEAMRTVTLTARNPDNAAAPAELRAVTPLDWQDRNVVALGVRIAISERTSLLAGFNYSRRPMADDTLSPIFAPIGEKHVTLGVACRVSAAYEFTGGVEVQLPERIRYSNPQLPFGPDTQVRLGYVALHMMLSRRW